MWKALRIWNTIRRLGAPAAGRWLAERHRRHIRQTLERELGRAPTDSEFRAAAIGAQGLIEGIF